MFLQCLQHQKAQQRPALRRQQQHQVNSSYKTLFCFHGDAATSLILVDKRYQPHDFVM